MTQHRDTSSPNRLCCSEYNHPAPEVALTAREDGGLHVQSHWSRMSSTDSSAYYNGLQHYLPDDAALQLVPLENPTSQSAPQTYFSRSEKWAVLGDDSPVASKSEAFPAKAEEAKQNERRKWPRIAVVLVAIITIVVVVIIATVIGVRRSHKATTTATE